MSSDKISIRFFDDREVRAIWNEKNAKWWFWFQKQKFYNRKKIVKLLQ